MRRPLFAVCMAVICILLICKVLNVLPPPVTPGAFPEGREEITVTGTVLREENGYDLLQVPGGILRIAQEDLQSVGLPKGTLSEDPLRIGEGVCVRGVFSPFSAASNPGEFDAAAYYRAKGIAGRILDPQITARDGRSAPLREGLRRLRERLKSRLYDVYPEKEAGILSDLLLGDKGALDPEVKALYQRNGIAHILSISGLHISLLGLGLFAALCRLGVPHRSSALLCALLILFYAQLTGMSVSAARSAGCFALSMGAVLAGRTADPLTSLGLMAAVLAIRDPEILTDCGFLLSFGSALGALVFLPRVERFFGIAARREPAGTEVLLPLPLRLARSAGRALAKGILASGSIILFTLPVQLYFFYEVPRYAVFLNLAVLPLMSLLLFGSLLPMLVPGLGILGTGSVLILRFFEAVCTLGDRLPWRLWNPGRPAPWQILVYYGILGMFCLLTSRGAENRAARWGRGRHASGRRICRIPEMPLRAGIFAGVLTLLLFSVSGVFRFHGAGVTFLSVGQGDGIVLRTGRGLGSSGEVYLLDGGSTSRDHVGQYVLKAYLKSRGISRIDRILLSHPDADHVNGALELLENREIWGFDIGALYVTDAFLESDSEFVPRILEAASGRFGEPVPVEGMRTGMCWQSGQVRMLCLHPAADFRAEDPNSASQCFLLQHLPSGDTVLFTGDVQEEGEERMTEALSRAMEDLGLSRIRILKAAHHGSRYSTPEAFLRLTDPELAILSCGRNNRYGHPHAELLMRLREAGCPYLRTDKTGAVSCFWRGRRLRIRTYTQM